MTNNTEYHQYYMTGKTQNMDHFTTEDCFSIYFSPQNVMLNKSGQIGELVECSKVNRFIWQVRVS